MADWRNLKGLGGLETYANRSILSKVKEDEDFGRRNTLSILRTEI
jgi:hypothetical protein